MSQKPIAYIWALAVLATVWAVPLVAHFFVDFPLERTLGVLAWVLSPVVALTWFVRPVRRLVYHPDSAARGGASQVAGAALGFAFIWFVIHFVIPLTLYD